MAAEDEAIVPELDFSAGAPQSAPTLEEAVELQEEKTLASLAQHPGWALFATEYRRQIMRLRTMADVDLSEKDDAAVGQLKRAYDLAAQKMEDELVRVEQIAEVIGEQGEE